MTTLKCGCEIEVIERFPDGSVRGVMEKICPGHKPILVDKNARYSIHDGKYRTP